MNSNVNTMDGATENQSSASSDHVPQVAAEVPTLDSIIQAICRNANQEPLRYVLRSNVGQDGE